MRLHRISCALVGAALAALALPASPAAAATAVNGARCTIVGTSGNDRLTGGAGNDVICGLGGDDTLIGNAGYDTLDGGTGKDRLVGGPGNDQEYGGAGNDVITGEDGSDNLQGGTENDDLTGQGGSDIINGGAGTNFCTPDPADRSMQACVYDQTPPSTVSATVAPTSVDVTDASRTVTYTVHMRDDTGVSRLQVQAFGSSSYPTLVSGGVRDGYWRGTAVAPRYLPPGPFGIEVDAFDRVGRSGNRSFADLGTIVDRNPDLQRPVLTNYALSTTTVDTRAGAASMTVTAWVTDDASGTDAVYACPSHQFSDTWRMAGGCTRLALLSGDGRAGAWRGSVPFPKGSFAGDWNMDIWTSDRIHQGSPAYWYGPEHYRSVKAGPGGADTDTTRPIPGGRGRFAVLGTGDTNAPALASVAIAPATIDTLTQPQVVGFDIRATDVEGINRVYLLVVGPEGASSQAQIAWLPLDAPTTGSRTDGLWRFEVTFPQGAPPGRYDVQVMLEDLSHSRSWVSPTMPGAGQNNDVPMSAAQTPGSDGVVTVVDSSGA